MLSLSLHGSSSETFSIYSVMTEKYFYIVNGQQLGPIAPEQFPKAGVNGNTMVWRRGMLRWVAAGQVPELAMYIVQLPEPDWKNPPPNRAESAKELNYRKTEEEKQVENGSNSTWHNVWESISAIFKVAASVFCVLLIIGGVIQLLIGQPPTATYYGKKALNNMWNLGWDD